MNRKIIKTRRRPTGLLPVQVYVLSVYYRMPEEGAPDPVVSAWSRKILTPLSKIRSGARAVFSGEEYYRSVYYQRDWAIMTRWSFRQILACVDTEIFRLRKVQTPEVFLAKYQDLMLDRNKISEYPLGALDDQD